jgi:quinoprotein dehydrogenase-associated probable ABC transporter substrate-binding protein
MLREAMVDAAIITGFWAAATAASARAHQARTSPTHLFVAAHEPAPPAPDATELRVCADPNNLPFSNAREQGFENDIATLAAHDLDRHVRYYWQPQRRGFIRTTLNAGWCDVVMGVPARYEMAKPTRPYYRSTYVFVSRRGAGRRIASLDDPRLRRLRIGVEMTGDDYSNPPALQALASRRIIDNVHGYLVFGDYSTPDPPRAIVDAVARGEVDTAIAWGPLAGYFASRSRVPLDLVPVTPERDGAGVVFTFDIAMATRRGDRVLNDALNRIIANRSREIRAILDRFRIPLVETGAQS